MAARTTLSVPSPVLILFCVGEQFAIKSDNSDLPGADDFLEHVPGVGCCATHPHVLGATRVSSEIYSLALHNARASVLQVARPQHHPHAGDERDFLRARL
jgi:hypothetical protein